MDFKFSDEDEAFRHSKEEFERRCAWHRTLYDGGWMCIHWPLEYGGRGATLIQQILYHEELDRVKAPPTVNFQGIARVGPTLMQWGTPEQKQRYIPKIPPAEEIWCQGLSEPNHGSDLAAVGRQASDVPVTVVTGAPDKAELARYQELGVERVNFYAPPEERDKVLPILDTYAALLSAELLR